ncbi:MAG: cupin domain-containing protein [Formivibrio sp.]|nr:cupin domain-containing protein [Formivibrio sp.]
MIFAARFTLASALALSVATAASAAEVTNTIPAVTSTTLLKTSTTWNGAPIVYSKTDQPEIQSVVVEIAPGAATVWHKHPVNNIAYILEGKVRLELENGTTREFQSGDAFAEVVNTWHRGVNIGNGPLKILVVYAGVDGVPLAIARDDIQGE